MDDTDNPEDSSDLQTEDSKVDERTAARARSLANLRPPFRKGEPPPPGSGRKPSLARQFAEMEERFKTTNTIEERMFLVAHNRLPGFKSRDVMEAKKWVLERKHGKAPEIQVNVDATAEVAGAFVELSREQLVALAGQSLDAGPLLASETTVEGHEVVDSSVDGEAYDANPLNSLPSTDE